MLHHETRNEDDFVVHELGGDAGEPLTDAELWDVLTHTFQSRRYQSPVLPTVATELLTLSPRADVDLDAIVRLIERDTLLASRVLKLCNSPLYGAIEPSGSLKAAVVRLSLAELRDVVMEAALSVRVFKQTGYSEAVDRVRVHSTAVAHLCRMLTRFTSFESEHAFLCGLLHDVGLSVALAALGDMPRGEKLRPVVDLWPSLEALHETVGGSVATVWKLPPEVAMVLRLHHTLKVGDVVHPVAAIVALAEALAAEHGLGLTPPAKKLPSLLFGTHRVDEPSFHRVQLAQNALGFDAEQMRRVRAAAAVTVQALSL